MYLKAGQTSNVRRFTSFAIFLKTSILNVSVSSEYASVSVSECFIVQRDKEKKTKTVLTHLNGLQQSVETLAYS